MDIPKIFVGLTSSFIQEKIQNGSVVNYLSDVSSASIITTKGETSLGLSKIRNNATVTLSTNEPETGVVESIKDDTIHLLNSKGAEIITKYDKIELQYQVESDDSYIVNFPSSSDEHEPTINYFTESITWTPNLILDFQSKTLSMAAVMKSSRKVPFFGDFVVVLISTISPPKYHGQYRAMASSNVESSSSNISDEATTTRPLIFKIGQMQLSNIFRFPLKINHIEPVSRNFIEISRWNGNVEGPAESGLIFDNPFFFPTGTLLIRQNHINTVTEIKSHQESEPVIVKTYLSDKIRFKSFLTDVSVEESPTSSSTSSISKKRRMKLKILVTKNSDRAENVTIILNVGDIGEYDVDPKPTDGMQKPGKIMWNMTAPSSSEIFEATINYQNPN